MCSNEYNTEEIAKELNISEEQCEELINNLEGVIYNLIEEYTKEQFNE